MTYCLGILLEDGLLLASDSRSNAGFDQIAEVNKLSLMPFAPDRLIALQSAGNLATTQAVITMLREAFGGGDPALDLKACRTMYEVTQIVGEQLRVAIAHDGAFVTPYANPGASFLVSGQIAGQPPRLFEIYSAGNFVEATDRAPFLQIGETKYGKPILDRALTRSSSLAEAAKLAMLSFDATIRSNLSVGLPLDVLLYRADSFSGANLVTVRSNDPYWVALREGYSAGLQGLIDGLPSPPKAWQPISRG
ncbi:peptidase [Phenylobacterium sp.]|uniref:peptidase n=1 Tax=Phenylobacterium sp. TaxID=1871053 RepID=UPI003BAAACF7